MSILYHEKPPTCSVTGHTEVANGIEELSGLKHKFESQLAL